MHSIWFIISFCSLLAKIGYLNLKYCFTTSQSYTSQSIHHCMLYNRVGWPSLLTRRKMHWYLIIYKAILGMLPSYLCCLIKQKAVEKYFLRSQIYYTLSVPFVRSELGKKAFIYAAPSDWNHLQSNLKLQSLMSLDLFKRVILQMEIDSMTCNCF